MHEIITETWPTNLVKERSKRAYYVQTVYLDTPADKLGIKTGWKLLQINTADTQNEVAMDDARMNGVKQLVLIKNEAEAEQGIVHILKGGLWPNGMILLPDIGEGFCEGVSKGQYTYQLLDKIWQDGAWQHFAKLEDVLIWLSVPLWLKLPDWFVPGWTWLRKQIPNRFLLNRIAAKDPFDQVIGSDRCFEMRYLALSLFANGKHKEALKVIERSEALFDAKPVAATDSFHALPAFIRALNEYLHGSIEEAKEQSDIAQYICQSRAILKLRGEIHRKRPGIKWSPWMKKSSP